MYHRLVDTVYSCPSKTLRYELPVGTGLAPVREKVAYVDRTRSLRASHTLSGRDCRDCALRLSCPHGCLHSLNIRTSCRIHTDHFASRDEQGNLYNKTSLS